MSLMAEQRTMATRAAADGDRFAEPFTFFTPDGLTANLQGLIGDISSMINPETGLPITGRQITIVVSEEALIAGMVELDFDLDQDHIVEINNIRWRVADRRRDRTFKLVTLFLEAWRN